MPRPPDRIIGEILGEPAILQRSPVNADYLCPFINSICIKQSHRLEGPYPVCSVWHRKAATRLFTTCPKRFFQADLINDVIQYCWPGDLPTNPRVVYEVGMEKFGTVDMVIADIDADHGIVGEFVSVELQAVDLTGSVVPAYTAILNSRSQVEATYGVNWANVRKRFMEQLISKSFYHHQWGTRVVAVLQTPFYDYLHEMIRFDEHLPGQNVTMDVMFMRYDYEERAEQGATHNLIFDRVVGTSHSSLMTHTLYQVPPSREVFASRILERI